MLNNLSSDKLRRQLDENNAAMNTLAEDNQKIVELLAERGLKAIEKTADEDLVFSADKMVIFNAAGAEVFNKDWPNPLVNPDQYEAHRRMARWLDTFQGVKEDRVPLTAEELKAGGWRCSDISEECRLTFYEKGLGARSTGWSTDTGYRYCYLSGSVIVRSFMQPSESSLKQIHRIGGDFYWGAP